MYVYGPPTPKKWRKSKKHRRVVGYSVNLNVAYHQEITNFYVFRSGDRITLVKCRAEKPLLARKQVARSVYLPRTVNMKLAVSDATLAGLSGDLRTLRRGLGHFFFSVSHVTAGIPRRERPPLFTEHAAVVSPLEASSQTAPSGTAGHPSLKVRHDAPSTVGKQRSRDLWSVKKKQRRWELFGSPPRKLEPCRRKKKDNMKNRAVTGARLRYLGLCFYEEGQDDRDKARLLRYTEYSNHQQPEVSSGRPEIS
uniref:40S ribosomal protein S11 n=1 Tax=Steinernema glaseri TaxID=37863 RepID=A0A1I8ASH9_9BILA